jgi:hypothetical protein
MALDDEPRWLRRATALALALALAASLSACSGGSSEVGEGSSESSEGSASSVSEFMEETAAADEDILTAEIVQLVSGVPDAYQSEFSLNEDADYQTAFDSDESGRLAIMTVLPGGAETFDGITAAIEGGITLDDIGDAAMAAENTVIFTDGTRTVLISTLEQQYPDGQRPALTGAQLEELARIAAARM